MKKLNYLFSGVLAVIAVVLFVQCSAKKSETSAETNTPEGGVAAGTTNMKIAYVEIDTLLTKYNFWNDLNEMMMRKEENIRATLNQKARELESEAKEFQRKYENGGFASRERMEQENARLTKKQQDLQELQNRLTNELAAENQKNSLQLRDSINSFLKEYNKTKGYGLIISNTGFDNLLYADSAFNITKEIIEGLNKRYNPSSNKK